MKAINLKLDTLVESIDPILLTREDNSILHSQRVSGYRSRRF